MGELAIVHSQTTVYRAHISRVTNSTRGFHRPCRVHWEEPLGEY